MAWHKNRGINSVPPGGPPKIKSVMLRTGILYRIATTECPNSCSSMLAKSMMAVTAPMNQYSSGGQFLNSAG
jgi:hypothetical protein